MNTKLILAISLILPSLVWASCEKNHIILKIESASDTEAEIAEQIINNHSRKLVINKESSNNINVETIETQKSIDNLILKLQTSLGESIKIEKVPVATMKKGTQDFGGM